MDQPGPGSASRRHVTDLESPLPDVGFAGGRNAVVDASVDHEPPRAGSILKKNDSFALQAIRAITGRGGGPCTIPMQVVDGSRRYSTTSSARASNVGAI